MIKGIVPASLIDWDGNICCVVFTGGCNYRCGFCHNPELIDMNKTESMNEDDILKIIDKKRKWVDGVCITGGEPLIHTEIKQFCGKIKSLGLKIKMDTNGSDPGFLMELIKEKLVDYIAVDIKSPKSKYKEITGVNVDIDAVQKSIDIVMNSGVEYEFRTTFVPDVLKKEDFIEIASWIKGAKRYFIQQFRPVNTYDRKYLEVEPCTIPELEKIRGLIKDNFELCELRNL
ncbi:MAG: anaerobic ribonucleoside-triphosphate reductase activating protein [Candidatus Nanoarchaeia archaeon]|nr:anaerobic ribonucleoside-triphosphate reductase activating protein [Candidatus Nanoarchaeia archaeon]